MDSKQIGILKEAKQRDQPVHVSSNKHLARMYLPLEHALEHCKITFKTYLY